MERLFGIGLSIAFGIGIGWYLFSGKVETVVEREVIVKYDTLILHRDTVIEHVERLQSMIVKYQTITDTVTKLQMCDTIVVKCDSLAEQYRQQDSLHSSFALPFTFAQVSASVANPSPGEVCPVAGRCVFHNYP